MRTLRPVAMCKWIDRADAEPLYKRALAMLKKALGPEHPHVAASLNNLAEFYRAQGKHTEAEPPRPDSAGSKVSDGATLCPEQK